MRRFLVALVLVACQGDPEQGTAVAPDAVVDAPAPPAPEKTAPAACVACEPGCACDHDDPCVDDVPLRFGQIPTSVAASRYLGARNPAAIPWPHYTSAAENNFGIDEHLQGIQRFGRYLLLTGSGRFFAPQTGHLVVIEMGTRAATGAWSLPAYGYDSLSPPAEDRVVSLVALDAGNWHAGGMQRVGDRLAVPLYGKDASRSEIRFYSLDDVTAPREIVSARIERASTNVKAVGAVRLADGRVLVVAWDDATLDFLVSKTGKLEDGFSSLHTVDPASVAGGFQGGGCGLSGCGTYQNLNFVRQCDGALYVVGTRNQQKGAPALAGDDLASLYRVELPSDASAAPTVTFTSRRTFACADQQCSFGAGTGIYVPDSTHLVLYGASHWLHDGNKRYNFNEFEAD